RMSDNMDIDASTILDGREPLRSVGERIFKAIIEVASGRKTKAEALGYRDFAVFTRSRIAEHLLGFC
ncbi:UxaA family hydrolase, partial [Candidatus Bathyarchaeota archaeon]|nr:UxaA family hydrolase [Candidatus Bathyarchaeota archaeon]